MPVSRAAAACHQREKQPVCLGRSDGRMRRRTSRQGHRPSLGRRICALIRAAWVAKNLQTGQMAIDDSDQSTPPPLAQLRMAISSLMNLSHRGNLPQSAGDSERIGDDLGGSGEPVWGGGYPARFRWPIIGANGAADRRSTAHRGHGGQLPRLQARVLCPQISPFPASSGATIPVTPTSSPTGANWPNISSSASTIPSPILLLPPNRF
ncbi:hypothetical protein VP01_480g2 [Puccinia sorghi]|uniref:Uncharacterized protein n=1 Tax=Puccinia sorghi TaxID=27349 RepID=A0A0L6UMK9_9BASI|nr:hypothetical protein VP01_480g2 [Puccinia sorghi]